MSITRIDYDDIMLAVNKAIVGGGKEIYFGEREVEFAHTRNDGNSMLELRNPPERVKFKDICGMSKCEFKNNFEYRSKLF